MDELTNTIEFAQGFVLTILITTIIIYILTVIANWKIFTKAGESGVKSLIPIYRVYILYKISWQPKFFWYLLVLQFCFVIVGNIENKGFLLSLLYLIIVICTLEIQAKFCSRIAKSFGKGIGFSIGLFFLPNIFQLILGLGSSNYQKIE